MMDVKPPVEETLVTALQIGDRVRFRGRTRRLLDIDDVAAHKQKLLHFQTEGSITSFIAYLPYDLQVMKVWQQ